jgi:proteasome lid subunit RPN8/RPN11
MPVEVCFLIGHDGTVLWSDRSASATAMPDSTLRWQAIWRHREQLAVIAHTHPTGVVAFSDEDLSTFAAIDAALGHALRYAVVTRQAVIYREPGGHRATGGDEPSWVALLRQCSGLTEGGPDGDSECDLPGTLR